MERAFSRFCSKIDEWKVNIHQDEILKVRLLHREKGFSLKKEIKKLSGPFVEIGGPSTNYWFTGKLLGDFLPANSLYISNISQRKGIDFRADGMQLPLEDESVDAVFARGLGNSPGFIEEASRVVKPGGLVVWEHFDFGAIAEAILSDLFFEEAWLRTKPHPEIYPRKVGNAILRKSK